MQDTYRHALNLLSKTTALEILLDTKARCSPCADSVVGITLDQSLAVLSHDCMDVAQQLYYSVQNDSTNAATPY